MAKRKAAADLAALKPIQPRHTFAEAGALLTSVLSKHHIHIPGFEVKPMLPKSNTDLSSDPIPDLKSETMLTPSWLRRPSMQFSKLRVAADLGVKNGGSVGGLFHPEVETSGDQAVAAVGAMKALFCTAAGPDDVHHHQVQMLVYRNTDSVRGKRAQKLDQSGLEDTVFSRQLQRGAFVAFKSHFSKQLDTRGYQLVFDGRYSIGLKLQASLFEYTYKL